MLLLGVVSFGTADVTFTSYESDHSALKVILPKNLKTFAGLDGVKHSQALFGTPSYGGDKMIAGELFYVTPGSLTGCDEYAESIPQNVPKGTSMIFLIDRGNCDFVQKMRTAQKLGAKAVIIADNICQCSDVENPSLWSDSSPTGRTSAQKLKCQQLADKARSDVRIGPTDTCERGLPFMADDGTGSDVSIPSFLIDYLDAQPFKDCIASAATGTATDLPTGSAFACDKGTKVVLSLEWDLPRKDNLVEWQLWSSSDSEGVFKKNFAVTAKKLQDSTLFTPHYFIWDGSKWGCTVGEICATQCTQGGLYCNPDPDHNLFNGVSGRDVVEENLRELCVWEQATDAKKSGIWWDYVVKFATECHPGETPVPDKFNLGCSERVQATIAGLDVQKTRDCVRTSWTTTTRNVKLDNELAKRADLNILTLPTAVVNTVLLRGGVTPLAILSSICAGFAAGKAPKVCTCVDRANSDNLMECINSECAPSEKLCAKDKKCYSAEQYATVCSDLCPKDTDVYCATLSQCLPQSQKCPECPDPKLPTYCPIRGKCVDSFLSCTPEVGPAGEKGTSAIGVFSITVLVVSIAGCGAYAFWRRQKARLHDDVRAILSSYMALEETDDADNSRVSRQSRRGEPAITPSQPVGSTSVGGQDAAQYI